MTVRLWDGQSGESIGRALIGHERPVNAVALCELDRRAVVVSASDDMNIWLWDGRTGKPIEEPHEGHTGAVNAVAVGAVDGRTVVVSGSK
jgi:WD40 repeat protein